MKPAPLAPGVHLFVCANRRAPGDPLGAGCADAGTAVFRALKAEVAARGETRRVWVTETRCLGLCPRVGAAVAVYPRQRVLTEVLADDAPRLYEEETGR